MKATTSKPAHNRVVRVTARNGKAVPGSETLLLELDAQTDARHVAGSLEFGPGGRLYVSSGDNMTSDNAQSLGNLHGKVLRINTDGSIPVTQPVLRPGHREEPGDLDAGAAQPVQDRLPARQRHRVHQRRRGEHLGGDQPGLPGRQLRLADPRGPRDGPVVHAAALRLQARLDRDHWVLHHRRRLLRPTAPAVPGRLRRRLLLCRPLHRLDPALRPGDRRDEPHSPPSRTTSFPSTSRWAAAGRCTC